MFFTNLFSALRVFEATGIGIFLEWYRCRYYKNSVLYFLDDRLKACLQEFEIGESEFVFGHEDGPTQSAWHQRRSKEISRWESVRPDIFRALVCAADPGSGIGVCCDCDSQIACIRYTMYSKKKLF